MYFSLQDLFVEADRGEAFGQFELDLGVPEVGDHAAVFCVVHPFAPSSKAGEDEALQYRPRQGLDER